MEYQTPAGNDTSPKGYESPQWKQLHTKSRVAVALARLAEETRCPVCFGILKQTVASTVCLHRFCATCIGKCLAGRPPQHKDCPVCRANLHSRRALRPDPNFDRLLMALYGDVVLYGQQEDALVAAHNVEVAAQAVQALAQAHAAQDQQRLMRKRSRAARGVPFAAPAAAAAAAATASERRPDRGGDSGSLGDGPAAADLPAPGSKRQHVRLLPLSEERPPEAAGLSRAATATMQLAPELRSPLGEPEGGTEDEDAIHGSCSVAAAAARPAHPRPSRAAVAPTASELVSPAARAAPAAAAAAIASSAAPSGPLPVPTAHSAAELSFRHPGMVVVRLQPGAPTGEVGSAAGSGLGGGSCSGGAGAGGDSSRPVRAVVPPALEKPFLLCPAQWTLTHITQLLSQWLSPRGYDPAAQPVPPAAIRLQPAPGQLRGSHRCLRSCTALGVLAAELLEQPHGGGRRAASSSGGGAGVDESVLVLLYSVVH